MHTFVIRCRKCGMTEAINTDESNAPLTKFVEMHTARRSDCNATVGDDGIYTHSAAYTGNGLISAQTVPPPLPMLTFRIHCNGCGLDHTQQLAKLGASDFLSRLHLREKPECKVAQAGPPHGDLTIEEVPN